jgi:serine/threonine-protein kinase
LLGEIVGRKYRIIRLLGKGGMGEVYEAEDIATGVRVAVKLLLTDPARKDDEAARVERFHREARAASAIDTLHIAQVLDWGTDEASAAPFMVMELLHGEDLNVALKRVGALLPDVAVRVVSQTLAGLQKAHEARVMHRDIKPANIFLSRRGDEIVVKLLDFGVAKFRPEEHQGGETTGLTRTGGMIGSPMYMSPEQARGLKAVDFRTDLWSLGVVLYRALTGHTPHEDTEALGDLIVAVCSIHPQPVQELAPWVPFEVAALVHGALQIDRELRFPSAAVMIESVRALLPEGDALRPDMFVPIGEAARAVVSPRLSETTVADRGAPGLLGRSASRTPAAETPPPPEPAITTTGGHVPASTATPMQRPQLPWKALAAAAAVLAGGAALLGVYRSGPSSTGARGSAQALDTAPLLAASSAAPAVAPVSDGASQSRRVQIAVLPGDASVEIDGAPAAVRDGKVEIEGALGSAHRVRVWKGRSEVDTSVAVTEAGAMPPRIDLGHAAGPGKAPGPSKTAAPRPSGGPLMPDRFE